MDELSVKSVLETIHNGEQILVQQLVYWTDVHSKTRARIIEAKAFLGRLKKFISKKQWRGLDIAVSTMLHAADLDVFRKCIRTPPGQDKNAFAAIRNDMRLIFVTIAQKLLDLSQTAHKTGDFFKHSKVDPDQAIEKMKSIMNLLDEIVEEDEEDGWIEVIKPHRRQIGEYWSDYYERISPKIWNDRRYITPSLLSQRLIQNAPKSFIQVVLDIEHERFTADSEYLKAEFGEDIDIEASTFAESVAELLVSSPVLYSSPPIQTSQDQERAYSSRAPTAVSSTEGSLAETSKGKAAEYVTANYQFPKSKSLAFTKLNSLS